MTTYIHTNFNSGLFLFLAVMGFYFTIEESEPVWLYLSAVSLISFGLLRIENVIMAMVVILIYFASQRIEAKYLQRAILPYLGFQFLWYLIVLLMDINTFTENLSDMQIIVILIGVAGTIGLILFANNKNFSKYLIPLLYRCLIIALILIFVVLAMMNTSNFVRNLSKVLMAMFGTGNWGSLWWVVVILMAVIPWLCHVPQIPELRRTIISFMVIIQILGIIRGSFHSGWNDSANRMLFHIIPLVVFTLISLIACVGSDQKNNWHLKKRS